MKETRTSAHRFIPFIILPVAIFSVQPFINLPIGNTFIWWAIFFVVLFLLFWESQFSIILPSDKKATQFVKIYLIWNLFSIVRGVFVAEDYWQYKNLVGMGMTLLMPLVVYIALNTQLTQKLMRFYINFTLPLAIILFPFLSVGAWGWYLYPIVLLALLYPALPSIGKLLVAAITVIILLGSFETRSILIKFSVPALLIFGFYYTRHFVDTVKVMKVLRWVLIGLPIFFFTLAVTNTFNIFKLDQYLKGEDVEVQSEGKGYDVENPMAKDTRTFLYEEAINSSIKYNYWLLGRTPARGNETEWFREEMIDFYGRPERPRNEVGILNVFTWTGIIGTVLFFLVFYKASYAAINNSKNIYSKLIGLYVAFRWFFIWIEDYQVMDTNNLTLWLMIGLSFSNTFREMTNLEVKLWVWGIFKKEYYWVYNYYFRNKKLKTT